MSLWDGDTNLFLDEDDPRGLGLRDDMLERALDFAATLQRRVEDGPVNYIFLGDFNIMGMQYRYVRERDIVATQELRKLEQGAKRKKMKVLDKDEPNTWWGGGKLAPSNLDFVVARDHIPFKKFGGSEVSVRGWPKIAEPDEQLRWVREMSDHGLLFFEVQRPPQ
jgi:hypothetical protein